MKAHLSYYPNNHVLIEMNPGTALNYKFVGCVNMKNLWLEICELRLNDCESVVSRLSKIPSLSWSSRNVSLSAVE